jgi:hypothetical protein
MGFRSQTEGEEMNRTEKLQNYKNKPFVNFFSELEEKRIYNKGRQDAINEIFSLIDEYPVCHNFLLFKQEINKKFKVKR